MGARRNPEVMLAGIELRRRSAIRFPPSVCGGKQEVGPLIARYGFSRPQVSRKSVVIASYATDFYVTSRTRKTIKTINNVYLLQGYIVALLLLDYRSTQHQGALK
jgi:hypothetical protein